MKKMFLAPFLHLPLAFLIFKTNIYLAQFGCKSLFSNSASQLEVLVYSIFSHYVLFVMYYKATLPFTDW